MKLFAFIVYFFATVGVVVLLNLVWFLMKDYNHNNESNE